MLGVLVQATLSGVLAGGVWPGRAPAGHSVYPYATYIHFRAGVVASLGGAADQQNDRLQLDVWGTSYLVAAAAARAIEVVLGDKSSGARLFGSPSLVAFLQTENQYFGVDPDVKLDRIMLEYSAWYNP